ncbi:DUF4142 domain-containing protein [Pontibacter litorisediminis]|uniref:DUF4142 domain-containing protein n=1 Tax=Pontibacter litorisediminis TaxID=1846260 RepID=UPI0023EC7AAB|nr:DUF4142 domain-containing protein [Pontibacter litorisediminis]
MFLDKIITFALAAIFLIALSCEGPASEESTAQEVPRKKTLQHEPAFWDYAASSNMLQVAVASVAAEQGAAAHTRSIAADALAFHRQALKRLQQLAQRHEHIQLPDSLGGADMGLVSEFKLLQGEELDTRFRDFVMSTHNAQLDRYEEALLKADDKETREWLMDMRAHLREEIHLMAAADSVAAVPEK